MEVWHQPKLWTLQTFGSVTLLSWYVATQRVRDWLQNGLQHKDYYAGHYKTYSTRLLIPQWSYLSWIMIQIYPVWYRHPTLAEHGFKLKASLAKWLGLLRLVASTGRTTHSEIWLPKLTQICKNQLNQSSTEVYHWPWVGDLLGNIRNLCRSSTGW